VKIIDIAVLEMGGTINGILKPDDPAPTESRVLAHLEKWQDELGIMLYPTIVTMKDSRAVNNVDRRALADAIRQTTSKRILIPHGTFTMPETGEFLLDICGKDIGNKSVILVGAMIPLGQPESDGPDNILFALEQLRIAPPGIWVAMNRRLWDPRAVVKDPDTGEFKAKTWE